MTREEIQEVVNITIMTYRRLNGEGFNGEEKELLSSKLYAYYSEGEKNTHIKAALKEIATAPYFSIIPMYYKDGETLEAIAEILAVDISTITRNKNKLLKQLYRLI